MRTLIILLGSPAAIVYNLVSQAAEILMKKHKLGPTIGTQNLGSNIFALFMVFIKVSKEIQREHFNRDIIL